MVHVGLGPAFFEILRTMRDPILVGPTLGSPFGVWLHRAASIDWGFLWAGVLMIRALIFFLVHLEAPDSHFGSRKLEMRWCLTWGSEPVKRLNTGALNG